MKLTSLDKRSMARLEGALRSGEPVSLELWNPPPPERRLDDIVPLCHDVLTWDRALTRSLQSFLPPAAEPGLGASVSAVIPTHRQTPLGLSALRGQDVDVRVVVLANNNAPDDVEGDLVVRTKWRGHALTRQEGIHRCESDYILLTVDDAIPCGAGFVRTLVQALEEGGFDAVCARQIPWPTSDAVTRRRLREWTPPGHKVTMRSQADNVATLYRRSTLIENPLPEVSIAEDLHWSRGKKVGYVPMAPVVHAHKRRAGELYRRSRAIHREHIRLGEPARVPSLISLLAALPGVARPVFEAGPSELINNTAELLGQWAASRDSE